MIYRKLTKDGDYTFGHNRSDFLDGIEAVSQAVRTKILLFYGEWWEDIGQGIPMFQSILGQVNRENISIALERLVDQRVREVKGVKSVKNIEAEIEGRKLKINMDVVTYSNEEINVEVVA